MSVLYSIDKNHTRTTGPYTFDDGFCCNKPSEKGPGLIKSNPSLSFWENDIPKKFNSVAAFRYTLL